MFVIKIYFAKTGDGTSSHELLFRAIEIHCGKCDFTLSYERGKKPYFTELDAPKFSISHSGDVWICAISDGEIGCDVQLHKPYPRYASIAERYFHPTEITEMNSAEEPLCTFFGTWVKKESVAKLTGRGLDSSLKESAVASLPLCVDHISLPICEPYSAAVASRELFVAKEIAVIKI